MPGLRKTRKRRKFKYHINRKKVQKSQEKYAKKNVRVEERIVRENWDSNLPLKENLERMGLAFDADRAINDGTTTKPTTENEVVNRLQAEADDATTKSKTAKFRFNSEEVRFLTEMLDKHGEDFEAMSKDPLNHYQQTPNQIQRKIKKFFSIPEQFAPYAKSRGLLS